MRFVAVSVHQHDVSRTHKRLHRDLVRSRSAVRPEEQIPTAKRPGCFFLGDFDIAGWFEQRIETAGGGGRFGQENVGAVKMTEVANPMRIEDRLPARYRQSVECADRPACVVFQVIEIRRVVALVHAL